MSNRPSRSGSVRSDTSSAPSTVAARSPSSSSITELPGYSGPTRETLEANKRKSEDRIAEVEAEEGGLPLEFRRRMLQVGPESFDAARRSLGDMSAAPADPYSFGDPTTERYFRNLSKYAEAQSEAEKEEKKLKDHKQDKIKLDKIDIRIQQAERGIALIEAEPKRKRKGRVKLEAEEKAAELAQTANNRLTKGIAEAAQAAAAKFPMQESEVIPDAIKKMSAQEIRVAIAEEDKKRAEGKESTARVSNLEEALEPENRGALMRYVRAKENLAQAKQERKDVSDRVSTFHEEEVTAARDAAQGRAEKIAQQAKLNDVDKEMAIAVSKSRVEDRHDTVLGKRLDRYWKDKLSLQYINGRLADLERAENRAREVEEAKRMAEVAETHQPHTSRAEVKENEDAFADIAHKVRNNETEGAREASRKEGFTFTDDKLTAEEQEALDKLIDQQKAKGAAKEAAVKAYVDKYAEKGADGKSKTKWTFEKLEKEVLGDNPDNGMWRRPKNINAKRAVYMDYLRKVDKLEMPLTRDEGRFSFQQQAYEARKDVAQPQKPRELTGAEKEAAQEAWFQRNLGRSGVEVNYGGEMPKTAQATPKGVQQGGARGVQGGGVFGGKN